MQYREIVSVTGMGGLYQLVASKSDGVIVRSLADNNTKFVSARKHNVTPLESIEVYTTGANVRLHEVLQKIIDSGKELPDVKAVGDKGVKEWFAGVMPDLDEDRVYTSDLKKMLKWFEILKGADLLNFTALSTEKIKEDAEVAQEAKASDVPKEKKEKSKKGDADQKEQGENLKPEEAKAQVAEKKKGDQTDLDGAVEGAEAEKKPAKKTAAKKAASKKTASKKTAAKKTDDK